jgi:hypothetical protein
MYPGEMEGLLRLAGPAVIKEILLEGRILSASEAYEKGLLTRVVKDEQVEDEAYASARRICQGAPLVAGWHKQWIRRLLDGRPLSDEKKPHPSPFSTPRITGKGWLPSWKNASPCSRRAEQSPHHLAGQGQQDAGKDPLQGLDRQLVGQTGTDRRSQHAHCGNPHHGRHVNKTKAARRQASRPQPFQM